MKTTDIYMTFNLLNIAKLTKMDDKDKFLVIKAVRQLKPIATDFSEAIEDAREKLKAENHSEWIKRADKWNAENAKKKTSELTPEDIDKRDKINEYFNSYNKKVNDCLKEEADKEHELTYTRLSEEAFAKLMASNDWTMHEILMINDALV